MTFMGRKMTFMETMLPGSHFLPLPKVTTSLINEGTFFPLAPGALLWPPLGAGSGVQNPVGLSGGRVWVTWKMPVTGDGM